MELPKFVAKTVLQLDRGQLSRIRQPKLNGLANSPETVISLNHSMRGGATVLAALPPLTPKGYIHY